VTFDYREYVEDNIDGARKSAGDEVISTCPWCDKPGHLSVNVSTGLWVCFRCGERGSFAKLIAEVEGITVGQAHALMMRQTVSFHKPREAAPEGLSERLKSLCGVPESPQTPEGMLTPLPPDFVPVWTLESGYSMPEYLLQRGVTRKAARHWGLGYCTRGRYADRIVMPFACPNGSSFTARAAVEMRGPRYLNPENAQHRHMIYGWKCAVVHPALALVEGPFDVIKMWQHGISAMGLLGKALHREQLRLLCRLPAATRIVLMLDPEARPGAFEAAAKLSGRFGSVWIAQLPAGVDPGKASKAQARAAWGGAERYTGDRAQALKAAIGMS